MRAVHLVVPAGIDDPCRPTGGNIFDRRICTGLVALGWQVREHHVGGSWPDPNAAALAALDEAVSAIPTGALLVVDGLIASAAATVLVPAAGRLRLVVLVHLPLAVPGEGAVLTSARGVVTTSDWARTQLLRHYPLTPALVHVVEPGVDPAPASVGTQTGGELLCVAAVSPHKGHDVLLSALAAAADLPWRCRCIGSLERDPVFVEQLRSQAVADGIGDRVNFCGVRRPAELARVYARSDLLVHASRGETYGMVVTEALAHALPVVATDVGGLTEALGDTCAGRPGLLVNSGEPSSLAAALRIWLADERVRTRLRKAAAQRRLTLASWETTATRFSQALAEVAA